MTVKEALHQRRAVKHYDPKFVMPAEDIKTLFESTLQTPSSFNLQHWRFALVTDKALREQLWEAAWKQDQVKDASLCVIVAGAYDNVKDAPKYWRNAPQEVRDMLVPMIEQFYQDDELNRIEAIRSASLASMSLMLQAKELGYDSCPMIGFDMGKFRELLKVPDSMEVVMMITVGKGVKPAQPKGGQLGVDEVVYENSFDGEPIKL